MNKIFIVAKSSDKILMNKSLDISGKFLWENETSSFLSKNLTTDIELLDLSTNHITENILKNNFSPIISDLDNKLTILNLTQCRLTEKASILLFDLLKNSRIQYLTLDRNYLPLGACTHLSEMLRTNKTLLYLSARGCDIMAYSFVEICKGLESHASIILRLDNNSIFDVGAEALAKSLESSYVKELSISDNQIWLLDKLLGSLIFKQCIEALDISYNILNQESLIKLDKCLSQISSLKMLNVSGCKIQQDKAVALLEYLSRSHLQMLMINGLNFKDMPIDWSKVQDTLWKGELFEYLKKIIERDTNLCDLRIGFLEPHQITEIWKFVDQLNGRELKLSLLDFGRTQNCWVVDLPSMEILSPIHIFKWNHPIQHDSVMDLITIIRFTRFENKEIEVVDLSECAMTTEVLRMFLSNTRDINIKEIDLSNNLGLNSDCIEDLKSFLANMNLNELKLLNTSLSDTDYKELFRYLRENPEHLPKRLIFGFIGDNDFDTYHEFLKEFIELVDNNCDIEHIEIHGPVTFHDASYLISKLKNNEYTNTLIFKDTFNKQYSFNDNSEDGHINLLKHLNHCLNNKESKCKLKKFVYPLLTEGFVYRDSRSIDYWRKIEEKLRINNEL